MLFLIRVPKLIVTSALYNFRLGRRADVFLLLHHWRLYHPVAGYFVLCSIRFLYGSRSLIELGHFEGFFCHGR